MSSARNHIKEIADRLVKEELFVAFFVHRRQYYWVVDWDEHFNLDYKANITAVCADQNLMCHLPAGISVEQHKKQLLRNFRGGISVLSEYNFEDYLALSSTNVMSTDDLASVFFGGHREDFYELHHQMEAYTSFGASELSGKCQRLHKRIEALLPTFYINFDRKIYLHMRARRFYEKVVLKDWHGAMADFEHMVPVTHRYWWRSEKEDYWVARRLGSLPW